MDEWQALVRKYMWRCFYCGNPVTAWQSDHGVMQIRQRNQERWWEASGKIMSATRAEMWTPENTLTKDHLIPLSRGGSNFIHNIRPADLRCNQLKGTKTVSEFLEERQVMIFQWLESLPADDWRVAEWNHWHTSQEIDEKIVKRMRHESRVGVIDSTTLSTGVRNGAQKSTGVFALDVKDFAFDVKKRNKNDFASKSLPLEVENEPGLLKKLRSERERTSWAWKNPPSA